MRPRSAYGVLGAAIVLGSLTGALVVPGPAPDPAASGAPPGPGTPGPSASGGAPADTPEPLAKNDLVTAADFARVDVEVDVELGRRPRTDAGVTACTEPNPDGRRTFRDLVGVQPELLALYRQDVSGDTAGEVAASAGSPSQAAAAADRLVAALAACEQTRAGEAVYGPPTRLDLPVGQSATWFGTYVDARKVDGRAPEGEEPCGGVVVAAVQERVAVLDVAICVSSAQLSSLAGLTVRRLA